MLKRRIRLALPTWIGLGLAQRQKLTLNSFLVELTFVLLHVLHRAQVIAHQVDSPASLKVSIIAIVI